MRWMVLVFGLALAGAAAAQAEGIQSGEQLLANCQSGKAEETASCRTYVSGAVDAFHTNQAITFYCIFMPSEGFSEEKAVEVVVAYLQAHPDGRSQSGAYNIRAALAEAYPCPK